MPNDIAIALDTDFDLLIVDGDFVVGESTMQHQALLLLCEKGSIREFPGVGVGIQSWLLDEFAGDLNGEVKRQFEQDGMTVVSVRGAGAQIQTEAYYG